jgi:glycosyltransferase involved in cell wall biosynthesis
MKKVLYVSNYNDGTGWGNSALYNILALDSAGVRVVPRAITFNGSKTTHPRIRQLEQDDLTNVDVCIQHTLPTLYTYNSAFKNIGLYETETNDFQYSQWPKFINIMDEAWVPNHQAKEASLTSGVKIPIKVAPHAIDYNKYQKIEKTAVISELQTSFNFCFVGELVTRKDITSLLIAFHTEFHPSENVNLFLKLSAPGLDSEQTLEEFNKLNDKVTKGLKLRNKYKSPVLMTGMLPEGHLLSLMKHCQCFVCTSHGEAWCIPAMEAMAMGMRVIYPKKSGMADFVHNSGWAVDSISSPCYGALDSLSETYSSFDTWENIDIKSFQIAMRSAYMKREAPDWQTLPKEYAKMYDYKTIGLRLKELL